jgi:hypothetical protein
MIDRKARQSLSALLRRLATGRVSNDEYEDSLPQSRIDSAIWGIHDNGAWYLYSDTREYKLAGQDALGRAARREVARWVLFLGTDLEYEWPEISPLIRPLLFPFSILTLGLAGRFARYVVSRGGDREVWPFSRRSDYENALRTSRLFAGVA